MGCLPFLPSALRPSAARLKATALDLAILAGHAVLYPTGVVQERWDRSREDRASAPSPTTSAESAESAKSTETARSALSTELTESTEGVRLTGPEQYVPSAEHLLDDPRSPRLPTGDGQDRLPVLLLHGFIDNRSVFVLLRRSLRQHGWDHVEALNYSPLSCDIRAAADLLGRHIEEFCERTGHDRVDAVGHSLGGLIARYYAQRLGGDTRVRTLVTLGTPHSGTRIVPLLSAHPIIRQMRPGSDVIEELALPAPGCATHFVSFWSDLDQIMIPLETAQLRHPDLVAHNVQVSGVGHLALPVHGAVAAGIRQALDAAAENGGGSEAASVA
ncbi:esterase/lipase family protein [Streptomyces sp. KR80]|uniref:esterase/lipase family protein n=1 Tax=Streptomyces sp. KR80 TaxID=3457426 RepID=UPI003FD56B76